MSKTPARDAEYLMRDTASHPAALTLAYKSRPACCEVRAWR
jgi:hypothetical protein